MPWILKGFPISNGMNPTNQENKEEKTPILSEATKSALYPIIKEVLIFALIAFGIVLPFRRYIAEPYMVSGASMDPTFETGDYLIVDKLSDRIGKPERNSVIVFQYPHDLSKNFIKRVIGLPGETLFMNNNKLTIVNKENPDGFTIDQSYIEKMCVTRDNGCVSTFQITLGASEYFVMGDNRSESFDSRNWGPVNEKYLLGKPVLRLWPASKIGLSPGADKTPSQK